MNAVTQQIELVPATEPARDPFFALVERAATDPAFDPDKVERLYALWERGKLNAAEAEFNTAMAVAQSEMEPVRADAINEGIKGGKAKYATYANLDREVRPIYTKHGFCLSFNAEPTDAPDMIRVVCLVSRGLFTRRYEIDMPCDGKGAQGNAVMTRTHATKSGMTYGRNTLFQMIFNLAVDKDDDGNAAGGRTYMGAPVANRQPAAETVVELKAENPVTPPATNHLTIKIDPKSDTRYVDFVNLYVEAMGKVQTIVEMQALMDANMVTMQAIKNNASPNAEPFKKRLVNATADARTRIAEARPTSAPPVTSKTSHATLVDPEAFIKDTIHRMDQCETTNALDLVWMRDIEPMEDKLFPSDYQTLLAHYRLRHGSLGGNGE